LVRVDDRGDLPVHPLRDQDRTGKTPQRLLRGGGPLLLAGLDLQEFGGEGQVGGRDPDLARDHVAQGHVLRVQVRGPGGQRGELVLDLVQRALQLADLGLGLPALLTGALLLGLELLAQIRDLPLRGQEHVLADRDPQLDGAQLRGELRRPLLAALAFDVEPGDLLLPVVDLAATGPTALLLQLGQIRARLGQVLGQTALLGGRPVLLELELFLFPVQQPHQVLGGEHVDVLTTVHQLGTARTHPLPSGVVLAQPPQQVPLLASGHERLVDLGEVVEVRQGLVGELEGARLVEHVVTQQGVDVAEFLGALDLVQQAEGLLVRDPEELAELGPELAELTEGLGAGMGLFEGLRLDLGGDELTQVRDVERGTGDDVQALDVRVRGVAGVQEQQPGQLDDVALAVGVAQRDHRQGGLLPQHLLAELAARRVVMHRPGAAHIARDGPTVLGTRRARIGGGGVEVQGARRGQQCADRVQQGGLAGAGAAGEEEALRGDGEVMGAVEGAPVRDLHMDQAPLPGVRVVRVHGSGRG
jgi:hypothetical protein